MSKYEKINKLLNEALRILDEIAREVVALKHTPDKENLRKIPEAVDMLSDVQNNVWEADSDLSVHYEAGKKADTKYMMIFRKRLVSAKSYEDSNHIANAIIELQKALDMEPPAIMHEVITNELKRLKRIGS